MKIVGMVFHWRRWLKERLKNPVLWKVLVSLAKVIYLIVKSICEICKLFQ